MTVGVTYPKYPLVLIEWIDHSSRDGWETIREACIDKPHIIKTVGWLLLQDKERYHVVMNLASDQDVCMQMVILKGTVKSFKVLRKNG